MNSPIFASEYWKMNTSKRSLLNGSAAVVGLSAGALGWSGLAQASDDEARLQTVLLPDHYSLQEDGVVVFSLTTGEQMTLSDDQYVILDGGLLLIVDELAQNAMTQLPVMGALRTELFMEFQPVRSPDGSIVEASNAQPLWTGEEAAPRLFEQVDIQRFELAQNGSEAETQSGTNIGQITSAAAGGLSLAGLSLASGIIGTEPEAAAEEVPATEPAAEPEPEFWTDDDIADSASVAITGSSGDSFVGYTAASTTATTTPLTNVGYGPGKAATFDMTAGGNNYLLAGDGAGREGAFTYTGGAASDTLEFGEYLGYSEGQATFNMVRGGKNSLSAQESAGGKYGSLDYQGGEGSDSLTFGDALGVGGAVTLDLGKDTAADTVTFLGTIGVSGVVTIKNFNFNHDTIDVELGVSATAEEIEDASGDLTWTDGDEDHTIIFEGIGSGGTGVTATTAQLLADII